MDMIAGQHAPDDAYAVLGAVSADTTAGKAINEARAFSRSLHETFDQGAVGRILKRTVDGSEAIAPDAALRKTVGRGGVDAKVDAANIRNAAPGAEDEIQDYLRGRFSDAIVNASGEFTPKTAKTWLRNNRELLNSNPALRGEFNRALSNRSSADGLAARSAARTKLAEAKSAPARLNLGQDEKAVLSIIGADDPLKAAQSIAATAKKDPTGRALAGVKAAFADYLVSGSTGKTGELSGSQMKSLLADKNTRAAMRQVFSSAEMGRMQLIEIELAKTNPGKIADVGVVMDSPANRLVEMVVRVAAARLGGALGGGSMGGSMRTANIFVERSRKMLRNLTNAKARQLLMDAIEDLALFNALLSEPKSVILPKAVRSKLAPYLTGAAANVGDDRKQAAR